MSNRIRHQSSTIYCNKIPCFSPTATYVCYPPCFNCAMYPIGATGNTGATGVQEQQEMVQLYHIH